MPALVFKSKCNPHPLLPKGLYQNQNLNKQKCLLACVKLQMWLVTCKSYRLQGAQGQRCDWRWFSVLYWPLMVRQNTDWRTEPSHPDKRQLSHRGSHALPQTCSLQCYSFELTLILLVRKRWSVYLLHKHVDNFQMCAFQWELLLFSFAFLEKLSGNVKRKKQQHFVVNRRVSQECKKKLLPISPKSHHTRRLKMIYCETAQS